MSEKDHSNGAALLPTVSVIVPVRDGFDRLERCVAALLAQDYPEDRRQIIVVDNGSVSAPSGLWDESAGVLLLTEPEPGSYRARNTGLARATGEIVAFTDADCLPATDWLSEAAGYLLEHPEVDMLGGRVELEYQHGGPRTGPEWFEFVEGFPQERYVRNGFAVTANMITRRSTLDRVGSFDAELLSGGDAEWGRRVRAAGGHQAYVNSAVVRHPARDTWAELRTKTIRTTAGVLRRTVRGSKPIRALLRLVLGQVVRLIRAPMLSRRQPLLTTSEARTKFLRTRWRVDLVILAMELRALTSMVRQLRSSGHPRRSAGKSLEQD